ncbi:hypothetical protein A2Y99_00130 [Candidatus Gottesmanbacteria bacterium RBG_13_37_7]|uniref:DUF5671 domain-containing protein n=1 Tax=Candidatus Gottesmanbacteria bacterium RBG_13_37_7 TaxID=1798369 RepID=A0A1F5YHJ4_9BACT|nr:MAG: hypothetical protein A2Y99_00130 [Candidatus Gottesmanbacteria bacterium RBG_13_37_7]
MEWDNCVITFPGNIKVPTIQCFEVVFANILTTAISLATLALFVMLVIGGFKYMTAGGDPKTATSARQTITYAVVGIVLLALAFIIFRIIYAFTGVDVTKFKIETF